MTPLFKPHVVLVFEKGRNKFSDKSDTVKELRWEDAWAVIKYKNSDREYKYSAQNIFRQTLQGVINPTINDLFINGEIQQNVSAIGDYGSHYGIITNRHHVPEYVAATQVRIEHNAGKEVLLYLKELAQYVKNKETEDSGNYETRPFLSMQIEKINLSKNTFINSYLNKLPVRNCVANETLIFPFDVNVSQKEAIKRALTHNVSIIQGPPGTGKTQSILNLVANLVCQGKSVGIVSNNNSAIENVKQKLDKAGYGFLMAHLGNNGNRARFFESLTEDFKPDSAWCQDVKAINDCAQKLAQIDEQIDRLMRAKEELARCKELLPRLKHEKELLHRTFNVRELPAQYAKLKLWNSEKLSTFKTILEYSPEKGAWLKRLSFRLKYGRVFSSARRARGAGVLLSMDSLIYDKKIAETTTSMHKLSTLLENADLKGLLKTCSELSDIIFKNALHERYAEQKEHAFNSANYQTQFDEFVERFPVIISTTYSILNSVPQPLDYIIIDESSQVDIITASLAFSACHNVVIVGDEQQLPHIVTDEVKEKANELRKQFEVSNEYDYVRHNAISSLSALYGDTVPKTLLREHYRCNPMIIGFCNKKYYKGQLIMMKDEPTDGYNENNYPIRIFRTALGARGYDMTNQRQIAVIEQEILPTYCDVQREGIGIITPYRNQANLLQKTGIESDTIHKFQGREKQRIIFSTVSDKITDFMDKPEIVNVAVSRAIDQFVMVMPHSYGELAHGSNIGDLIRYIEHWNPHGAVQSEIVSYFDLLRTEYSPRLEEFKRRVKGASRWESENIIETAILEILNKNPAYSGFSLSRGYPLYLLTPNKQGLTDREIAFSNNPLSHVDFLIINRCDNSFVLAVEVDGYTYHSRAKQQERDQIKNKVLALNGIELLRLSTSGHQEADKIREKLRLTTSTNFLNDITT